MYYAMHLAGNSRRPVALDTRKENIEKILLFGRNLSSLPTELFCSPIPTNLTLLDISNNRLNQLPDKICLLTSLKYLYAFDNEIKKITVKIKFLTNLISIDFSRNQIEEIPEEVSNLTELKWLNLSGNSIRIVPKCLLALPKLEKLFLLRNLLLENIPREVALKGLQAMRAYLNVSVEVKTNRNSTENSCLTLHFNDLHRTVENPMDKYVEYKTCSVIGNLVRLFSDQMKLINDYRNKIQLYHKQLTASTSYKVPDQAGKDLKRHDSPRTCNSCGLLQDLDYLSQRFSSTSEYGSLSFTHIDDVALSNVFDNIGSCSGNDGSFTSDWDTQNESLSSLEAFDESSDEILLNCDFKSYQYINAFQELVIMNKGVKLTIPKRNLSQHPAEDFFVDVIDNPNYYPTHDSWSVLASPVVHLGPHRAKFYPSLPARVTVPIGIACEEGDIIECYTSDTDFNEAARWQKLEVQEMYVTGCFIQFEVTHFSLFAVVCTKTRHQSTKRIEAVVGGSVHLSDGNQINVVVEFSRNSLNTSAMDASITLLYYDTFYVSDDMFDTPYNVLAGPVISLGPGGCQFNYGVQVTIPLPKGKEVLNWHDHPTLLFKCSQTGVGVKPEWVGFEPEYSINWGCHPCTVTFTVHHFTLFSVFWNILDVSLPEHLKLHASSYVPHFSFWVYFQALMSDCSHNTQFGICVLCYRFGSQSSQGLAQYPLEVGVCKPRKVRTGKLNIQLKSGMFDADEAAGESPTGLTKTADFTGHDFDVHFACFFNSTTVPEVGLFGKVEISSAEDYQGDEFSFNLIKSIRRENPVPSTADKRSPSEWESKFTKELAGLLSIDDHMWQELALSLGYNRSEIQVKFSRQIEPIHEMLADYMSRGGSADEFMNAMYRVARMFKLIPLDEMKENKKNRRLELKELYEQKNIPGPSSQICACPQASRTTAVGKRKIDASYSSEPLTESKFDDIAGEISKSWKSIGRKLNVSEPELREIDLNYQHAGEKEKAFQMLITWRERDPENCVPTTLYSVLHDSGLKYTAMKSLK